MKPSKRRPKSIQSSRQKLSDESSISTDQSLEDSMMKEFWTDFDHENKIRDEVQKFQFLNLDDPFLAAYDKEK